MSVVRSYYESDSGAFGVDPRLDDDLAHYSAAELAAHAAFYTLLDALFTGAVYLGAWLVAWLVYQRVRSAATGGRGSAGARKFS